jgi:hypothetical protein
MTRILLPIIASLALAACSLDLAAPEPNLTVLMAGLNVTLSVEPADVQQHAPFTVRLGVTNPTSDTIRITTAHGCLALPHVLRNGQRIPFVGSALGCTAAITQHTFPPGDSRWLTWQMRAELYAEHPGEVEGVPAPRGTYTVQAEFDTFFPDSSGRKPVVERSLRVR